MTVVFVFLISLGIIAAVWAAVPLDIAGYLDFSFGSNPGSKVTGEKPESKLWWNSGYWWGSLYDQAASEHRIFRLDVNNQVWENTGVAIDDRPDSRADVLWDNVAKKLYITSHVHRDNPSPINDPNEWARLYRYSFNPDGLTYTLDSGFPVTVNEDRTETLVLDKDSFGRLWVTYVSREAGSSDYHVYINSSQGNDLTWGTPFMLTSPATKVNIDDISSLISYSDDDGPQVGVMWSNQEDDYFYFAAHPDSAAPQDGWSIEAITAVGYPADDHINLAATPTGQVVAAVKLETTDPDDPLMGVIGRDSDGSFSFHTITFVSTLETRPGVVVDTSNNKLVVYATNKASGGHICYWMATITNPLSDLAFPQLPCVANSSGNALILIGDSNYNRINYATSTKQNINSISGLAVLASDEINGDFYVHNVIFQSPPPPTSTAIPSPSPTPSKTPTPTVTPVGQSNKILLPIVVK